MVGAVGGGIFAKIAKTPPLQSALRSHCAPNIAHFSPVAMRIPCTPHAARLWGSIIFITMRRAASLRSSRNGFS